MSSPKVAQLQMAYIHDMGTGTTDPESQAEPPGYSTLSSWCFPPRAKFVFPTSVRC